MAHVEISSSLFEEIEKKFKRDATKVFDLLEAFEQNPHRGKAVGHVDQMIIKELKYGKFRFYCITDGHVLKFGTEDELAALLVKFVRMSEKKDQERVIGEIKKILRTLGFDKL